MTQDDRPIPQKAPYLRDEITGAKFWCACGRSMAQPYCDGSHKGTSFQPLRVAYTEPKKSVAWCGCKRTKTPPYCDGSHRALS